MKSIARYCFILAMGLVGVASGVAGAQDRPNKEVRINSVKIERS